MTREEQIDRLQNIIDRYEGEDMWQTLTDKRDYECIKAAIEALKTEPCNDAISRQAAIVQLSHNKTGDDDCDVIIQKDIETIKALPPVTTRGELPSCENCMNGNQEEKAKLCQKSYLAGMEHSRQEPCEDAISRQAVLDKMKERDEELSSICPKDIKELPPVTPQQKTGHWIALGNYDYYGNECSYKCSECGERNTYPDNYCHECGTKMIEPIEIRRK